MKWLKSDIGIFLLKVVIIYLLWYLFYDLWLLPDSHLDLRVIRSIIDSVSASLQLLHYHVYHVGRIIGIDGTQGIILVNGCSGVSAIGLFAGFILAFPGQWMSRFCYILVGTGIIYLTNILRIAVLVIIQKYRPSLFQLTHDYSTTAVFYLVIFILWMIWVNFGDQKLNFLKPATSTLAE